MSTPTTTEAKKYPRKRSRTIDMDETNSTLIRVCANHQGMSSHQFIQTAIAERMRSVLAEMLGQ